MQITFSDGFTTEVNRLGLFELDEIKPEPLGPFTYEMEIMGKMHEVEFDFRNYVIPPSMPETPEGEALPNTPEWYAWNDYKLYVAACEHDRKRKAQQVDFVNRVAAYILNLYPETVPHIITQDDWEKLYEAALVTPVTIYHLATTLKKTYQAHFEGRDVLEALADLSSEQGGSYDTVRMWENKLMVEMNMTEVEYALLSVEERSRKICALFLPEIMSALEMDRKDKLDKKKRGKH